LFVLEISNFTLENVQILRWKMLKSYFGKKKKKKKKIFDYFKIDLFIKAKCCLYKTVRSKIVKLWGGWVAGWMCGWVVVKEVLFIA
jgi:hypothetical protein